MTDIEKTGRFYMVMLLVIALVTIAAWSMKIFNDKELQSKDMWTPKCGLACQQLAVENDLVLRNYLIRNTEPSVRAFRNDEGKADAIIVRRLE